MTYNNDVIDCKVRIDAYFMNMNKYENDIRIRVRFLYKIFKAAVDWNYTFEEHEMVLKRLLEDAENSTDEVYKILDLCFCYKIKKIIGSSIEVPIIRAENMIMATSYEDREIPDFAKKVLIERGRKLPFAFAEAIKSDPEIKELYNVHISRDHFYHSKNVEYEKNVDKQSE